MPSQIMDLKHNESRETKIFPQKPILKALEMAYYLLQKKKKNMEGEIELPIRTSRMELFCFLFVWFFLTASGPILGALNI